MFLEQTMHGLALKKPTIDAARFQKQILDGIELGAG